MRFPYLLFVSPQAEESPTPRCLPTACHFALFRKGWGEGVFRSLDPALSFCFNSLPPLKDFFPSPAEPVDGLKGLRPDRDKSQQCGCQLSRSSLIMDNDRRKLENHNNGSSEESSTRGWVGGMISIEDMEGV